MSFLGSALCYTSICAETVLINGFLGNVDNNCIVSVWYSIGVALWSFGMFHCFKTRNKITDVEEFD